MTSEEYNAMIERADDAELRAYAMREAEKALAEGRTQDADAMASLLYHFMAPADRKW